MVTSEPFFNKTNKVVTINSRIPEETVVQPEAKITVADLSVFYRTQQALHQVSMNIPACQVTALIGPSGCGKSTFLRSLNRMNDIIDGIRIEGRITIDGEDVYSPITDIVKLRRRVGMVFQKSNPFPKSIFDNVAYGPQVHGIQDKEELRFIVERSLIHAGLWDEVKDRLKTSAMGLSGGQQQRLCIARTLAVNPDIVLMDEPTSALDPKATTRLEQLILDLRQNYTIVIVTHNMQQAARISDQTAFFYEGQLVEYGSTQQVFNSPSSTQTEDYICGRFG